MMFKYVINCRPYNHPEQVVHLALEDGRIHHIEYILPKNSDVIFDAENRIAAPGLIDTHVHGCGGGNPSDGKKSSLRTMAATLCRLGTTSFYATSFYCPGSDTAYLKLMADYKSGILDADCLGIHLEGPFINPKRKGGIPSNCLTTPDERVFLDILKVCNDRLSIMTLAPELDHSDKILNICHKKGIVASFGHSDANFNEAREGLKQGIGLVTHITNAMRPFNNRKPGPLPAILESGIPVQIISDGVHLHPETVSFIYHILGPDRCICITDGIEATGLKDGEYIFQGKPYKSENGAAFYSDGSGLIGTSLSLFDIMMRFKKFTDCSLYEAVKTAAENPAVCLGVDDRKGFIKSGYDADIIFINKNDTLHAVMKAGKLV
ncbi:MAG: N-acetylglucosamine-6-phosphate deacetylase [Candidatus Marinimicrobia bacterium]|nr:N-acetylglucosamine-6-phosphate deacetylase [Candidatus Neomarinimicrobiota bacterium]